jgi:chemotaxis protein CheX
VIKTEVLKTKCKIKLPDTLDANASVALQAALIAVINEDKPLDIDASAVSRIDTLCSQLLLNASLTYKNNATAFSFTKNNAMFIETLKLLGMHAELVESNSI